MRHRSTPRARAETPHSEIPYGFRAVLSIAAGHLPSHFAA
jgi:hypothetical protein